VQDDGRLNQLGLPVPPPDNLPSKGLLIVDSVHPSDARLSLPKPGLRVKIVAPVEPRPVVGPQVESREEKRDGSRPSALNGPVKSASFGRPENLVGIKQKYPIVLDESHGKVQLRGIVPFDLFHRVMHNL
jgi:hypothetical protein